MGKGWNRHLCIYCDINYSTPTGDHVPPDKISPAGTPQVTVPCCMACNIGFSDLDEVMRNKFARLSEHAPLEIHQTLGRVYEKYPGKIKKMNIQSSTGADGRLLETMRFEQPALNQWFARIVRGMHFHQFKERLPDFLTLTTTALTYAPPIPNEHRAFLQDDPRSSCFFCEPMPGFVAEKFVGPGGGGWMSVVYQKLFFVTIIT